MAINLTMVSKEIFEKCNECALCQKECHFLQKYGQPKSIADQYNRMDGEDRRIAFECSLCGLCAAVCPAEIDPSRMFQEMRREAVRLGRGELLEHKALLKYEKRGTSKRYTWYGLPLGCDTILFPGCTLPGTRPEAVSRLYEHLKKNIAALGVVLDCCTKPSLDLGRQVYFKTMFGEMTGYLLEHGVRKVLVACPNCYKIFKEYGDPLHVEMVYEVLTENGPPLMEKVSSTVAIHDPCVVRFESPIHKAVRELTASTGVSIEEMSHNRQTTLCCGEGGAAGFLSPELAKDWAALRKEEAQGRRMITYCAGCVNHLNSISPTSHVLDLLFQPQATLAGKIKSSPSPMTYWNRIRLKHWFKKNINAPVSRKRIISFRD